MVGGRGLRDTQTQGRSLLHKASPNRGHGPQRQRRCGVPGWSPLPLIPAPSSLTPQPPWLSTGNRALEFGALCSPLTRDKVSGSGDSGLAKGTVTTWGRERAGNRSYGGCACAVTVTEEGLAAASPVTREEEQDFSPQA